MYTPAAFREDDPAIVRQIMRDARLSMLVTSTQDGLVATPLPLFLADEGEHGVLYGHVAKANPQWKTPVIGDALAIFTGPDAYISPSWYASKAEHGKVVPTWNYVAVHAYGSVEFFEDETRLLDVVTHLTNLHEGERASPWAVSDAPADFIQSQLRGIVGLRMPITRVEGKQKLSQNRSEKDRDGVAAGLKTSGRAEERIMSGLIPRGPKS